MDTYVKGIDISIYQRAHRDGTHLLFDPQEVARAGYQFAICRLGHGVTVDVWGADSVKRLQAAGLKCSVYWYFAAGQSAMDQANKFLSAMGSLDLDFAPALDVEEGDGATAQKALQWLDAVDGALDQAPLVYTMPAFSAAKLASHPEFTNYDLWQATYTSMPAPMQCEPWAKDVWLVWQFSNAAQVPGIATPCDVNRAKAGLW